MVRDENTRLVEDKIDKAEELFSEKKYAEVLRISKEISKLSTGNRKAAKLEEKAQKAYKEEIQKLRENFKKAQIERLSKILEETPAELPDELFSLESNNPRDPDVFALTKEFRDKLVERKINEKQDLIYSNKYDVIESFIEQLKKIDQKNPRITKVVEFVASRKNEQQFNAKKEFIYKGQKYLDTMMQLKKYDKVMQAAQEILAYEKNNKVVEDTYNTARKKLFRQTRNTVAETIKGNFPQLRQEYLNNKGAFVKL